MRWLRLITRLPALLVKGLVIAYRKTVSPHTPPTCRFTPTCSQYAIEALDKYGFVKGLILSIHRVLRCNPWGGHGYDPPRWYTERSSD